jgi:hypothetical protein
MSMPARLRISPRTITVSTFRGVRAGDNRGGWIVQGNGVDVVGPDQDDVEDRVGGIADMG